MHYKRKKTAKQKTTSYYLSSEILKKLAFIAFMEAQSVSVILERMILYAKFSNWQRAKKCYKKKKKIHTKKERNRFFIQRCKESEAKQKCLFDECD